MNNIDLRMLRYIGQGDP